MQFTTTVTQKGQATIPVSIRQKLGIKTNTKVIFELKNSTEAILKPVPDFLSFQGSLKTDKPFDVEAMDEAIGKYLSKEYEKEDH